MSEHDMDARMRDWARAPATQAAPDELRRQVLAIPLPETTNRRRSGARLTPSPKPTAEVDGDGDRARLMPTNPPDGGTRSMFSATKLFGIAVSIALVSALAVAVPYTNQQQGNQAPGAEAAGASEITSFTGRIEILGQDKAVRAEQLEWGYSIPGEQWTARLTTTDPRYSGLTTGFHNIYEVGPAQSALRVQTSRLFTQDENGTWMTSGQAYQDPETMLVTWVTSSDGEGTYEGLTAYSICEQLTGALELDCHGIVFEGDWPEFPSDAPTEFNAAYGTP